MIRCTCSLMIVMMHLSRTFAGTQRRFIGRKLLGQFSGLPLFSIGTTLEVFHSTGMTPWLTASLRMEDRTPVISVLANFNSSGSTRSGPGARPFFSKWMECSARDGVIQLQFVSEDTLSREAIRYFLFKLRCSCLLYTSPSPRD